MCVVNATLDLLDTRLALAAMMCPVDENVRRTLHERRKSETTTLARKHKQALSSATRMI